MDESHSSLADIRLRHRIYLPMMERADEAFDRFNLGWDPYRMVPPMYIVIDKHGIVRHRSIVRGGGGREKIVEIAEIIKELLEKE